MLAWGFGFWKWRLTLARSALFQLSADYSSVMCWTWPGTLYRDLTVASVETLISDMHYVSELLVPVFGRPVLLYRGWTTLARRIAACVRDG